MASFGYGKRKPYQGPLSTGHGQRTPYQGPLSTGHGQRTPYQGPLSTGRDRLALAIVTCGGAGYVPWAPGTAGTVVGVVVVGLTAGHPAWQLALLLIAMGLAIALIPTAQRVFRQEDPSQVVIDEFCGMLLAVLGLSWSWRTVGLAFLGFRALDILKPPPIRQLERMPGAWGVLADDLAAGALVNLILRLASHWCR